MLNWLHATGLSASSPKVAHYLKYITAKSEYMFGILRFTIIIKHSTDSEMMIAPQFRPRFSIVAKDVRREVFVKQLNRPTFRLNGLSEICTFLDYVNVYDWYVRLTESKAN